MTYVEFSYRLFGDLSKSLKPYFMDIKDDMQHAKIQYTLEEYLSIAITTTLIAFLSEIAILSFTLGLLIDPLVAVVGAFILSSVLSAVLFFGFYAYPITISKSRQSKIDKVLPFAVSYLATLSSSRAPPTELFKAIAQFKEYGEFTEEAKGITNSIEFFGLTAASAIRKQAKATPSKELRDILWSISTLITSGGDLTGYLHNKSNTLMEDYQRKIRKFSQDLSLYIEIYLTLVITGSIFFIVLSSIIAVLSAGLETVLIQSFIIFILLPMFSIMFIVLIKSLSPLE